MDIRKLQRAIVDGLEDVKAQDIAVFDTEHLSPLFERVIIASGTSNRQTKALAASVRDAVKAEGFHVPRTEGEVNGEWIIVDCGAAVVHVMQPTIREYYHLEEIWGDKPVKLKSERSTRLVKAEEPAPVAKKAPAKKAPAKKAAAKKAPAKPAPVAKKPAAKKAAAPAKAAPARKVAAKKAAAPVRTLKVNEPVAKKAPAKKVAAKKAAAPRAAAPKAGVTRTTGVKSTPVALKKAPAKKAVPAKKAAARK
jgi:ribosome-associated protein